MPHILNAECLLNTNTKSLEDLKSTLFESTKSQANKLQFIKNEIESGCYLINNELVAEKLLEHARIKVAEIA